MPRIIAGERPTPRHGGWWRPMGAASHRPHARSLRPNATQPSGQIPCQHLGRPCRCPMYTPTFIYLDFLYLATKLDSAGYTTTHCGGKRNIIITIDSHHRELRQRPIYRASCLLWVHLIVLLKVCSKLRSCGQLEALFEVR
jgi:hypothetical protein